MTFSHDAAGTPAAEWHAEVARHHLLPVSIADRPEDELERVVVLAAHPDDETLGAGGLVARAHDAGLEVVVVVATRGEASHPHSPTHDRDRLAAARSDELRTAVEVLAPGAAHRTHLLDRPDGEVAAHEDDLACVVVELVGDGRRTLLVAPWRHDGHPDHEAVGRAAATVSVRTGARLLEYPVWFWHWGRPGDAPWSAGRRLELGAAALARKAAAVAAHRTQVDALSELPGDEVLLGPEFLEHFATPYEIYWEQEVDDPALDALHRSAPDPWGVDHRPYERRKRAIVRAMLPRASFRRGLELGCSTGALAADLAEHCSALVALDASRSAVESATTRLAPHPHVEVLHARLPDGLPGGTFDLVVLSEVGYFLSPVALESTARRIVERLRPDGVVVLCHWRHPVVGWPLDGPAVHRALLRLGLPPVVAEYRDRDVEVLVLASTDPLPQPSERDQADRPST